MSPTSGRSARVVIALFCVLYVDILMIYWYIINIKRLVDIIYSVYNINVLYLSEKCQVHWISTIISVEAQVWIGASL